MIDKKALPDLTRAEYKALYAANYGYGGYMRGTLVENKNNPDAFALMIWSTADHQKNSELKAWVLVTPVSLKGDAQGTRYTKTKAKYSVQFWVKRQWRKQGLAHALMREVKKYDERPHCFPHDQPSGEFFSNYDITATREERIWLKKKPKVA
jgi:GNAT superfamily N-acetyltransferase